MVVQLPVSAENVRSRISISTVPVSSRGASGPNDRSVTSPVRVAFATISWPNPLKFGGAGGDATTEVKVNVPSSAHPPAGGKQLAAPLTLNGAPSTGRVGVLETMSALAVPAATMPDANAVRAQIQRAARRLDMGPSNVRCDNDVSGTLGESSKKGARL